MIWPHCLGVPREDIANRQIANSQPEIRMSVAVKVSAVEDTVSPWLRELEDRVAPELICAEVGPRCTRLVQRNFRSLGQNQRGWPSTQFYGRAAEETNWQAFTGYVDIVVDQIGIRQRLEGGPITPQKAGALTIPISPVSYGKTVADFPGAFLLCTPKGAWIVQYGTGLLYVADQATHGAKGSAAMHAKAARGLGGNAASRKAASLNFLFVLSKGVTQTANSRVLPSDEEFDGEFDKSVKALLKE